MPEKIYDKVKEYIKKRIQIPDQDLEESFHHSTPRHYRKGDYILKIGEYCRFIGFLNSGLIVSTIIFDGKEVACGFCFENCFVTYSEGISYDEPSHKNYIALENCEMLVLEKDKIPLIFSINRKFETLFSQILAEDLRNVLLAQQHINTQSVKNRYLQFIENYPVAFGRIPLKYIAGYLGIEPPSLSRLRKRLAGK